MLTWIVPLQPVPAFEIVILSWLFWPRSTLVGIAVVDTWICVFEAAPVDESATVWALGSMSRWPLAEAPLAVGTNTRGTVEGSPPAEAPIFTEPPVGVTVSLATPFASVFDWEGAPASPCDVIVSGWLGSAAPPAASTRTVAVTDFPTFSVDGNLISTFYGPWSRAASFEILSYSVETSDEPATDALTSPGRASPIWPWT